MKTYEHTPFTDINIPYLTTPAFNRREAARMWWQTLAYTPLPFFTRWMIYQALREPLI